MASDFEKALARAAAERASLEDARAQQRRHRAEMEELAHSIIHPFLDGLGPQVTSALRNLGVPTNRHRARSGRLIKRFGTAGGNDLDYWEFRCAHDLPDLAETIRLNTSGTFASETYQNVGLVQAGQLEYMISRHSGTAYLFANLDDRKVYVSRKLLRGFSNEFDPSQLQELGEFLAQYIDGGMKG